MGKFKKIAVYGGGSWGCALAQQLARRQKNVDLVVKDAATAEEIASFHTNNKYLGDLQLLPNISASDNFSKLNNNEAIIIATPSSAFLQTLARFKESKLPTDVVLLIATKGVVLDNSNTELLSSKAKEILPNRVAFISGPNFAKEVIQGLLTEVTIASEDISLAEKLANSIKSENFITHITNDIITVQIAGAVKNIIAIKSGMYDMQGYKENAKAALITQGLKEISILSKVLGGRVETILEPAVVGDLVLTCYSKTSRNTKFGYELAAAKDKKGFLENYPYLVEGSYSAMLITNWIKKYNLKLPVISSVAESLGIF